MSVDVQGRHEHKQFSINSTQFEEIVPKTNEDERSSKKEMKKESDTEEQIDKEEKKQRKKSDSNYSSDDQRSYEDDFEEIETPGPRKVQKKSKLQDGKSSPKRRSLSRSPEISTVKSSSVLSRRSGRKFKKNYKAHESPRTSSPASCRPEKSWGRPKNRSANAKMSRLDETVVDRVLSANRHKVQKLESRLSQLIKELTLEKNENKTLRQIHYRQEKELVKVNNEEAELPRLLTKHTTEVKSLRERMRRQHETTLQKENKLNEQDKEILKLRDKCKHYKDLCEMKNLTERADLQKKLANAQDNLEKKDSEILKLQRMVNLKEKAHARHLNEQKDKARETESRLKQMEENYNYLQERLKEKEKQLDYTNIYQRQIVLKEKGQSLPESLPKMAALPAPKKTKKPNTIIKNNNKNNSNKKADELEVNKKPDSFFLTSHVHSDTGSDKELDKSGDDTVGIKQLSITDRGDIGMTSLNKNQTIEEEMAEQNERLKKEEFERSLHEEDERLKIEKEKLERKKKEDDEREERERVEREAKWREDSARRAREEQERRQESARRKREEEERRKLEEEAKEKQKEDSFFDGEEARKKKEQLLARLKAIDNGKASDENLYNSDDKRSSNGKTDHETMKQNGLPPLGKESRIVSPTVSVKSDPDGISGIPRNKPVLIGRGGFQKKSTQFSWLDEKNNKKPGGNIVKQNDFGDYSPSVTKKTSGELDGDIFGSGHSHKAGRGRRRDAGPSGESGFNFGERRGSGGFEKPKTQNNLPFLSQDFGSKNKGRSISPSNNEPLLPRRKRAQEKNGPAISSVFDDNLDDDIEELTL